MTATFRPDPPVVIGLTGGIAAGKSTVAALLEERGFVVVDADRIAREVVRDPAIAERIRARFGAGVFAADGSLARERLAQAVFDDVAARRDLEAITHPAIRRRIVERLEAALASGASVVLDVPLLVEGGLSERCDAILFVAAPDDVRAARARGRGWADTELERREAAQSDLAVKKAMSTATIDASGTLDRTCRELDAFLAQWRKSRP